MTAMTESNPTLAQRFHWRRLFQYRLRTLLILTTIIAVLLGWWSYKARQQREAVAALKKVGGFFSYDFHEKGLDRPPYWPVWLVDRVGVDYFANVEAGDFVNNSTDAGLENLECLTSLKEISLDRTHVTDKSLEYMKGLTKLRLIGLSETKVTDAGLEFLQDLIALETLNLDNTHVSDAGLEYLKGLKSLKYLSLVNTQVTDAGAARLKKALPKCQISTGQR